MQKINKKIKNSPVQRGSFGALPERKKALLSLSLSLSLFLSLSLSFKSVPYNLLARYMSESTSAIVQSFYKKNLLQLTKDILLTSIFRIQVSLFKSAILQKAY